MALFDPYFFIVGKETFFYDKDNQGRVRHCRYIVCILAPVLACFVLVTVACDTLLVITLFSNLRRAIEDSELATRTRRLGLGINSTTDNGCSSKV